MMHLRRRWTFPFLLATLLAGPLSLQAASLASDASAMEAATGDGCRVIRDRVLSNAPPAARVVDRDKYGADVVADFGPIVANSKNADAVLNSAILIAEMETISTDATLESMLKNADAAVRYWAAKGLTALLPRLKPLGPGAVGRAVGALNAAGKSEKDPLVFAQINKALAAAGAPAIAAAPATAPSGQ
jgi:hypothetical protein